MCCDDEKGKYFLYYKNNLIYTKNVYSHHTILEQKIFLV